MQALRTSVAFAALACTLACASSHREAPTASEHAARAAPPRAAMSAGTAELCPLAVPNTTVSTADVEGGEALTFTTTSSQVDELRSRVHAMAEMHARRHAGGAEGPGAEGMGPPPSTAVAEDVSGGARIVARPKDPADLDRLRAFAREHAERMQRDGCLGMMDAHHGG